MAQQIPAVAYEKLPITSIDPRMLKASPPVFIFNVGPEQHNVTRGGLGTFVIPACPKGERVSPALEITGIYPQHQNLGEVVTVGYIHGIDLAEDILGTKSTLPTKHEFTTNLAWKGVFITSSPTPSDDEIEAANAKRVEHLKFFVEDGDRRTLMGPGDNGSGGIGPNHRNAVQELKLKRQWSDPVVAQEECPACGSSIKGGIAVCPHCTAVVDPVKARQFFPERFASQDQGTSEAAPEPSAADRSKKRS